MNTLAILEKFEIVEITNESRITGEELEFCTAQQALYAKVLGQHCYAFDVLQQLKNDCKAFMRSVASDNKYQSHGHTYQRYSCKYVEISKEDFVKDHIIKIHEKFISVIINYFTEKYNVSIDKPKYEIFLGLKKPDNPERPFYGYRKLSDEEKEKIVAQERAYKEAHDAYLDSIINAELDYNTLLDHIFVELNGSTFAERAEQEIKRASRKATSDKWSKPEIKNKKITMDILSPRKGWRDQYEVELNGEGYHAILCALTYLSTAKSSKARFIRGGIISWVTPRMNLMASLIHIRSAAPRFSPSVITKMASLRLLSMLTPPLCSLHRSTFTARGVKDDY